MKIGSEWGEPLAGESAAQLQDQIALQLRQMIQDGRIPPGERLLEAQIAKAFSVSRSPARRALEILSAEKLVREHDRRGYLVSGAAEPGKAGNLATLEPTKLSQSRQWEVMYGEVEQHLFAAVLLAPVRINDQRLAEHFGVSRTVTRDLLARMHGLGLISKDRAGHWIAEQVTPERIHHLFEMRKLLEPHALLQAGPLVPLKVLEQARSSVIAAIETPPASSTTFDQVETDLHVTILGYAPNKEVLRALHRTHLLFGPTRYLLDPLLGIPSELIDAALKEHLTIIEKLIDGKIEPAARELHGHIDAAIDRWLRRFRSAREIAEIDLPPYLTSRPAGATGTIPS